MNRLTKVYMYLSPDSHYSDVRALLDSYAVEINITGLTYLRIPLYFCQMGVPTIPASFTAGHIQGPVLDETTEVKMLKYEPSHDDDDGTSDNTHHTRWPFFVENPLSIQFFLSSDQWWEFKFIPEEMYTERKY